MERINKERRPRYRSWSTQPTKAASTCPVVEPSGEAESPALPTSGRARSNRS
ncbi:hypothetical protein PC114_g7598 [Phytophthora cactorum]|uniref:Uncharacterized protein n=1 Tax=Phytophthora cactorum TaxID=29920 RepID=A0A8T1DR59_9STRA|nr:hypothetical protein PC114_g7598 [Phytophthora cactorum]KAG2942259.1 hypothetical protein PC117_g9854 [Phytophthora cactorum]KAG3173350.1 hypothetical protein PC128_g18315 [Phytophthora cactorum]